MNAQAERMVALYRREEEHWSPHEMLEELFHSCPNMLAGTAARAFTRMKRPRCTRAVVRGMAESAIREMVNRGHAAEVEAFVRTMEEARAPINAAAMRSRLNAGLERLAMRSDAPAVLEMIELVVDALAGNVVLGVDERSALVDGLRALAANPGTRRAVDKVETALALRGAA